METARSNQAGNPGNSSWLLPLVSAGLIAAFSPSAVVAGDVVSSGPLEQARRPSAQQIEQALPRMPMLESESQIPKAIGAEGEIVAPMGYGTANHPFTTKGAYSGPNNRTPSHIRPWNATGKLWMRFGTSWFVCSGSVITNPSRRDTGLVATAAHCVYEYGTPNGWADQVYFEPARFGSGTGSYALPYGDWDVTDMLVPGVYTNGTDVCDPASVGIVCENDVALLVMTPNAAGKLPGEVIRPLEYYRNDDPYTSFAGMSAAQITQFGYPVAFDSGRKMIRTDSLGYRATPSNVIIGSDQTGGSSGGPWIMNFGPNPSSTSSTPAFNHSNRVVATTSWGYISQSIKVAGASRFTTNAAFPSVSNIQALVDAACSFYPDRCDL